MGRELRRKEEKKNKKINKQLDLNTDIKLITVLKVVFATILVLLVLYYILAVFVTKEIDVSGNNNSTSNEDVNSSISNKILASAIFNQTKESYYVYFYDFNDEDSSIASAISNSDISIYRVDTSSSLNKKYVTDDTGNREVNSIDNLLVKNPTIIKVENDQVIAYYEGSMEILAFLNS